MAPNPSESGTPVDVKPRSRDVTDGIQKAAARAMLRAVGLTDDMLHGVISFHEEATPTCGLLQSSSVRPTARNIARAAAF